MKRVLASIVFILAPALSIGAQLDIPPCQGVVTNYEGSQLSDKFCSGAQNVIFDGELGTKKPDGIARHNSVSLGSQSVYEMGRYIDSALNEFLVVVSSNVFAFDVGNGTFTTIISTVNPKVPVDCVDALGRFICSSSTQAFYWIGGAKTLDVTTTPTSFPFGNAIEKHANRLWVTSVKGSPSILYGSAFLNMDRWTLGGNAGDPVQITIGINDGDTNTCMKSFGDGLVIGKKRSMWVLLGKSQNDFVLKNLSTQVGCLQDDSMQEKQGKLYWMSSRGIEKLEGGVISQAGPFSDPIKDIVDKLVSGYDVTVSNSVSDTNQSDFSLGTSTFAVFNNPVGAVTFPLPSSGSVSNMNVASTGNDLEGVPASFNMVGQTFKLPFYVSANLLSLKVNIYAVQNFPHYFLNVTLRNSDASFSTRPSNVALSTIQFHSVSVDLPEGYASGNCSGYPLQGNTVDLRFSTPLILTPNVTYWVTMASTMTFGSPQCNQYRWQVLEHNGYANGFRYRRNYNNGDEWGGQDALLEQDVYLQLSFSSGQFVSNVKDLGPSLKTVSFFNSNFTLSGANILFYSRGSNSQAGLASTNWSLQTNGATAAVNNSRFIQWRADFIATNPTQTASIQDVTIQWFDSTSKQNVASWVLDDRYYLSGSTNTGSGSTNETVVIVDKFDNFTFLNDIPASSFAEAFQNKYIGTSVSTGAKGGLVFRITPDVYTYLDQPIESFVETKDYCGEQGCYNRKDWQNLYVRTRSDGSTGGNLTVSQMVNRFGTYTTLGNVSLDDGPGIISSKIPFPVGTQGRSVRFKFGNRQAGHDFRFFGARIIYDDFPLD